MNTAVSLNLVRKAVRTLEREEAKKFTSIVKSSVKYDTHAIQAAYWGVAHVDVEPDIRNITGFIAAENYGTEKPVENEIGSVGYVRFIKTTTAYSWADGGGAKGSMVSTTGVSADVYPILIFAKDSYALVPLKGESALTPMVVNPKPSDSDPLGQRGHVGWKAYHTAVILNDAWMIRLEVAATDL